MGNSENPKPRARILWVDDDKSQTKQAVYCLSKLGYAVTTAVNGVDGLMLAVKNPPDVIVSDNFMDVIDGPTFCANVRRNSVLAHIPFILVSALEFSRRAKAEALKAGVTMTVERTPSMGSIIAAIESLLRPTSAE